MFFQHKDFTLPVKSDQLATINILKTQNAKHNAVEHLWSRKSKDRKFPPLLCSYISTLLWESGSAIKHSLPLLVGKISSSLEIFQEQQEHQPISGPTELPVRQVKTVHHLPMDYRYLQSYFKWCLFNVHHDFVTYC